MPKDRESELFYRVDEKDNVLGFITRKEAHRNREIIHRSVYVLVRNIQGQLLFQKRSPNKDTYPGHWALGVAGHVTYGQTYEEAAVREVQEELGEKVEVKPILITIMEMPSETEYCAIFESGTLNKSTFNHDADEVSETMWVDSNKIKDFTDKNVTTPDTLIVLKMLGYI